MKMFSLFLISLVILSFTAQAQIQNSSFESWDSDSPTNRTEMVFLAQNITKVSDAYHGSYAVQMEIVDYYGLPFPSLLISVDDNSPSAPGHPVSAKYTKLKGYFKLDLKGSAQFGGNIVMFDENQLGIGFGGFTLNNSSSDWISIEVPIEYSSDKVPSYAYIQFALLDSSDGDGDVTTIGSTVKIDHLSLEGAVTSVALNDNTPLTFALDQNYPNPFNPSTTIRYSIPNESEVSLSVYNALGAKVDELYSGTQTAGNFEVNWNASNFSSGVYFLRMSAVSMQNSKSFTDVKKLILLK
ncbi:MAG: T9SS type A sorting domain-containing protein [Melioribacteraceae bacterium]|nr:T9SS type A sorting domain-containing protein [Melioribacteraceae bacterium]